VCPQRRNPKCPNTSSAFGTPTTPKKPPAWTPKHFPTAPSARSTAPQSPWPPRPWALLSIDTPQLQRCAFDCGPAAHAESQIPCLNAAETSRIIGIPAIPKLALNQAAATATMSLPAASNRGTHHAKATPIRPRGSRRRHLHARFRSRRNPIPNPRTQRQLQRRDHSSRLARFLRKHEYSGHLELVRLGLGPACLPGFCRARERFLKGNRGVECKRRVSARVHGGHDPQQPAWRPRDIRCESRCFRTLHADNRYRVLCFNLGRQSSHELQPPETRCGPPGDDRVSVRLPVVLRGAERRRVFHHRKRNDEYIRAVRPTVRRL